MNGSSASMFLLVCRWDIQRIREQRMFQRLQQRMNKKKVREPESEPELSSLYPDTEDGESPRQFNMPPAPLLHL